MTTVHAVLGASSAKRWFSCPGSIDFVRNQPPSHLDTSSDYADEGTDAHDLAEKCLVNGEDAIKHTDSPLLAEAVQEYLDIVRKTLDGCLNPEIKIEERFWITTELFGTNDALIWDDMIGVLHVFDYKHGAGVSVQVEENLQLSYYALGAMKSMNIKPEKIYLYIVQPRCDQGGGSWEAPEGYFNKFKKELFEAVERVKEKDAPLVAGGHCHFCPGIAVCPAYKSKIIETTQHSMLSENYQLGQYLGKWKAALDRVVYKALSMGGLVPGLKLVEKKSNRKWKDPNQLTKELVKNEKAFEPKKLKSPAQLEKVLGKDFVGEHAFKPQGGLTVALENDKRPAWTKAQHDFADVKGETK